MSALPSVAASSGPSEKNAIRVMIVDDAVVVRGLFTRWLGERPEIDVIGAYRNGRLAVDALDKHDPHIIILDIEMPEMDGLTALPLILKKRPRAQVIMASTLTTRNAEISLKALGLGARDYIPKPEGNHKVTTATDFRRDLIDKILALGSRAAGRPLPTSGSGAAAHSLVQATAAHAAKPRQALPPLRKPGLTRPRILAIGSSTGGPQALLKILPEIVPSLAGVPVVVTQHMPASFTATLAQHIARATGLVAKEGEDGETLKNNTIYVAPGGRHMAIEKTVSGPAIVLSDGPQINYCKPAVDPLFQSVASVYGPAALALVLTGMGNDGAAGSVKIADAGGSVIAQDEASSVVWGMPGAVAHAGSACAILPLDGIGTKVKAMLGGRL